MCVRFAVQLVSPKLQQDEIKFVLHTAFLSVISYIITKILNYIHVNKICGKLKESPVVILN